MTSPATIRIANIGPIKLLTWQFRPGVTVLQGRNGTGKTTARRVVSALGGDKAARKGLTPRDGEKRGWARGPGVHLRVGGRTSVDGTPAIELADDALLGRLIDPPLKDAGARNRERIKILTALADVDVDRALLVRLADGDDQLAAQVVEGLDLEEAAKCLKKAAWKEAQFFETQRDEQSGAAKEAAKEVAFVEGEIGDYPRPDGGIEGLRSAYQQAVAHHRDIELGVAARRAAERERAEIGRELGKEPNVAGARSYAAHVQEQVDGLRQALLEAEKELARASAELLAKEEAHRDWSAKKAKLGGPIEGPTDDELAKAAEAVERAEIDVDTERYYERRDEAAAKAEKAEAESSAAAERASYYRALASGVMERVSQELLAAFDWGDILVDEDGVLCVQNPETGDREPFERLSSGQKVRRVVTQVGLKIYPQRVLSLEPEYWSALDPSAREEMIRIAVEEDVELLTEEPTASPEIEVVHFGAVAEDQL